MRTRLPSSGLLQPLVKRRLMMPPEQQLLQWLRLWPSFPRFLASRPMELVLSTESHRKLGSYVQLNLLERLATLEPQASVVREVAEVVAVTVVKVTSPPRLSSQTLLSTLRLRMPGSTREISSRKLSQARHLKAQPMVFKALLSRSLLFLRPQVTTRHHLSLMICPANPRIAPKPARDLVDAIGVARSRRRTLRPSVKVVSTMAIAVTAEEVAAVVACVVVALVAMDVVDHEDPVLMLKPFLSD